MVILKPIDKISLNSALLQINIFSELLIFFSNQNLIPK